MEVLGSRMRNEPAPPRFVHEALSTPSRDPFRPWLTLLDDEQIPRILESEVPSLLVWSSLWTKPPQARLRFEITPGADGSDLRWTLFDVEDPGPVLVGHMRKRVNVLINANLRYTLGQ